MPARPQHAQGGRTGLGIVSDTTSVLVIAILDVIAKVVYGYMSVQSDTAATDKDLAEGKPKLNMSVAYSDGYQPGIPTQASR